MLSNQPITVIVSLFPPCLCWWYVVLVRCLGQKAVWWSLKSGRSVLGSSLCPGAKVGPIPHLPTAVCIWRDWHEHSVLHQRTPWHSSSG